MRQKVKPDLCSSKNGRILHKCKIVCLKCGQTIEGDLKGTFIKCRCGKTAIDQTKAYTRLIGNQKDYRLVK